MKFFNYCFYRIATFYLNRKFDYNSSLISAIGLVTFCQLGNILSLITIPYIYTKNSYSLELSLYIGIPLCIVNLFLTNVNKKYSILKDRWNEEVLKRKKINGYIVFLYVVLSTFVSFFMYYIMYIGSGSGW